jgi:hypothetical protein
MGVVAHGAGRVLPIHVLLVQKRIGLIVDEKIPVVALVTKGVVGKRLHLGVFCPVLPLEDGRINRAVRSAGICAGGGPLVVVVTIRAVNDAPRGVRRLEASYGRVPACGRNGMVGGVAGVDFLTDIAGVVLAKNPASGGLIGYSVTFQAYLVLIGRTDNGCPGNIYSPNPSEGPRDRGRTRGRTGGNCLVRVMTIDTSHVTGNRAGILTWIVGPIRRVYAVGV